MAETRKPAAAMSAKDRRVHITLPADLLEEIDASVAPRQRSQFIQEAVAEIVRGMRLKAAIAEMAGSLADVDIPGWESPEAAAEWVRTLRGGGVPSAPASTED